MIDSLEPAMLYLRKKQNILYYYYIFVVFLEIDVADHFFPRVGRLAWVQGLPGE